MRINIKTGLLLIITILNFSFSFGQNSQVDTLKIRIKKCADELANSFVIKDYETVIKYMDTKTVEALGGKEKVIELFKNGFGDGAEIQSVEISIPSDTININNIIQCTLNEVIRIKTKEGILLTKSTLIGISNDNGSTWYFIDANGAPIDKLKLRYPYLSDRLIIEPQSFPILLRE